METMIIPNPDNGLGQPQNNANTGATDTGAPKNVVSEEQAINSTSNATIPTLSPLDGKTTQVSNSVAVGELINGKFLTDIMDALLPALLVVLAYAIGMQIKKSELQLTEKEKNTLAPLVQKCVDTLMINFNNPWTALGVSMLVLYGAKFAEKGGVAWVDKLAEKIKPPAEKKPAKIEEIISEVKQDAPGITNEQLRELEKWQPTEEQIKNKRRSGTKRSRTYIIEALKRDYMRVEKAKLSLR